MRLRLALVLGWVAACAPASMPRAPGTKGANLPRYGVFVKPGVADRDAETRPTPPPVIELPLFSTAARPAPPSGVACTIYGRGTARYARCGAMTVDVTATHSSDVTTAVIDLREAEFAWGFFPNRKKAWIFVEDGTFTVDAFADPKDARFALRREVGAIPEHVWLKEGIAVRATSASERGVAVVIDDEVAGIEQIPMRVPCDALLFDEDRTPPSTIVPPPPAASTEDRVVYASHESLALHLAPGEGRLAALGSSDRPFMLPLTVIEQRGSWMRVGFETESARFNLWAKESDVSDALGLQSIGTSSCCGGVGIGRGSTSPAVVLETTRVIVGKAPWGAPTPSVTIKKGAEVEIDALEGGFAAIRPRGPVVVSPPEGASFWVPESMLVR